MILKGYYSKCYVNLIIVIFYFILIKVFKILKKEYTKNTTRMFSQNIL